MSVDHSVRLEEELWQHGSTSVLLSHVRVRPVVHRAQGCEWTKCMFYQKMYLYMLTARTSSREYS